MISAAKSTRPTRPAPNPNFESEGQPDTPLFAALRDQSDSTRFTDWAGGFNPIQPVKPNQKNSPFFNCRFFPILRCEKEVQSGYSILGDSICILYGRFSFCVGKNATTTKKIGKKAQLKKGEIFWIRVSG